MQQFHQSQLIPAPPSPEFYRIHAFPYEMQTQAAGPHIFQFASAELVVVYRHAAILQHNFEASFVCAIPCLLNASEGRFDRLLCLSLIRVPNDVRQRLVDRQNQGAAFLLRESQRLRELPERGSHHAKHLRIAPQFHFEEQAAPVHLSALSPAYEAEIAR
jgi:hypothetical protein